MFAGFAKTNINPPDGLHLAGYGGRDVAAPASGIHDDLFVSALWFDHGGEKVLLLSYDLLLFDKRDVAKFKAKLHAEFALEPRQILLNTSHTHNAPNTCTWGPGGSVNPPDAKYMQAILDATVDAARRACDAAKPVLMYAGYTTTKLPVSRRMLNTEGKAEWRPDPNVPILNSLPFLLLRESPHADGKPVCLLYCVSCHPSTTGGHVITADYPGAANRYLDQALGTTCAMFLQGCGGDTKASVIANGAPDASNGPTWRSGNWDDIDRAGKIVADDVLAALKNAPQIAPSVATAITETRLPLHNLFTRQQLSEFANKPTRDWLSAWAQSQLAILDKGQSLATHAPIAVQAIRLSKDLRLIAIEGEPVANIGRHAERLFRNGITFPVGYSNGQGLYIPSESMLPEGGYEVESAHEYGFPGTLAPGFEETLFEPVAQFKKAGVV